MLNNVFITPFRTLCINYLKGPFEFFKAQTVFKAQAVLVWCVSFDFHDIQTSHLRLANSSVTLSELVANWLVWSKISVRNLPAMALPDSQYSQLKTFFHLAWLNTPTASRKILTIGLQESLEISFSASAT